MQIDKRQEKRPRNACHSYKHTHKHTHRECSSLFWMSDKCLKPIALRELNLERMAKGTTIQEEADRRTLITVLFLTRLGSSASQSAAAPERLSSTLKLLHVTSPWEMSEFCTMAKDGLWIHWHHHNMANITYTGVIFRHRRSAFAGCIKHSMVMFLKARTDLKGGKDDFCLSKMQNLQALIYSTPPNLTI